MTVGELVARLQECDQDAYVAIDGDKYDDWVEIDIKIDEGMFGLEDQNYGWFFKPREGEEPESHHFPCVLLKSVWDD